MKVSVVINCYNGEKYLREAISSVFSQKYQNWELIFYDNQSTDSSYSIIKSFDSSRIRYIKSRIFLDLGHARCEAIKHADGDWIAFIDVDDLWYPNRLLDQLAAVAGTDFALIYSGVDVIDENGMHICKHQPSVKQGKLLNHLLNHFDINMVTPLINRRFINDHNLNFNKEIHASEEYNLFTRIAAKGLIKSISDIHGAYRVYDGSLTDKKINKWAIDRAITLRQLVVENPHLALWKNESFCKARAHIQYYAARYYMSIGNKSKARLKLKKVKSITKVYYLLWVLSYSYILWNIMHNRKLKSYIYKVVKD